MIISRNIRDFLKYMRSGGVVYAPVDFVNDKDQFIGKVVLVTGGATGIGFELAKKFLSKGARVILSDTREDILKETMLMLHSDNLKYIIWDTADVNSVEIKLNESIALFGDISIFVNNAGVFDNGTWERYDLKTYNSILDTNAKGLFFISQAEGKYLLKKKLGGKILNLCSSFNIDDTQFGPYAVSKWGAICITKGLAKELVKNGIVVNGVALGNIHMNLVSDDMTDYNENSNTQEHLAKHCNLIDEVTNIVVFLASDSANSIIGQIIEVDGSCNIH